MVIAEPLLLATQATVYRHRRRREAETAATVGYTDHTSSGCNLSMVEYHYHNWLLHSSSVNFHF